MALFLTIIISIGYLALAYYDIKYRRLPNWGISLLCIGCFIGYVSGLFTFKGQSLVLALLVLGIIAFGLYFQSVIGAGDTKMTAVSLLITGDPNLLITIALCGGLLSVIYLSIKKITNKNNDLPYGVAIGGASLLHLWSLNG